MEVRLLFQILLQLGSFLLVAYVCHKGETWSKPVVKRKIAKKKKKVRQTNYFMFKILEPIIKLG